MRLVLSWQQRQPSRHKTATGHMNTDANAFFKSLVNWIPWHKKRIAQRSKMGTTPGLEVRFNMWVSINANNINRKWDGSDDHFISCQIWPKPKPFYKKNKIQTRKRELLQYNKSPEKSPQLTHSQLSKIKSISPAKINKNTCFYHSTIY